MSNNVMPSQTGYELKGLNETFEIMKDLTSTEKRAILLGMFKKVSNSVVKPALQSVNPYTASKKQPGKNPFMVTLDKNNPLGVKVGVSSNFFYYRFTEFGTKKRSTFHRSLVLKIRKSGKVSVGRTKKVAENANRGKMQGNEKIYKEIANVVPAVVDYINENYRKITESRMRALARKKAK